MTTPAYMAPEMIVQKESTTKVDMWALGVILYQMFANKLPFEADNYFDTMLLIR
jgi:serine/threonine protein kinase